MQLVPKRVRDAILEIPPEWFEWDEKKLLVQVYNGALDDDDLQLRLSFWEEYESCFESCTPMKTENIIKGIISKACFYKNVLSSPGRVLFIITEPSYYKKRQKLIHHLALNRVLAITKEEIRYDAKTGLPDTKMMDLQLKAYQYIDQRLHGGLIQKHQVEQRSQNVNVNVHASTEIKQMPNNIDDIDKRIAAMEEELAGPALSPAHTPISPTEAVHKEAGRVMDAEFVNLHSNRDNSHRE